MKTNFRQTFDTEVNKWAHDPRHVIFLLNKWCFILLSQVYDKLCPYYLLHVFSISSRFNMKKWLKDYPMSRISVHFDGYGSNAGVRGFGCGNNTKYLSRPHIKVPVKIK